MTIHHPFWPRENNGSYSVVAVPIRFFIRCRSELGKGSCPAKHYTTQVIAVASIIHVDLSSKNRLQQIQDEIRCLFDNPEKFGIALKINEDHLIDHVLAGADKPRMDFEVPGLEDVLLLSDKDVEMALDALAERGWRGHLVADCWTKISRNR